MSTGLIEGENVADQGLEEAVSIVVGKVLVEFFSEIAEGNLDVFYAYSFATEIVGFVRGVAETEHVGWEESAFA